MKTLFLKLISVVLVFNFLSYTLGNDVFADENISVLANMNPPKRIYVDQPWGYDNGDVAYFRIRYMGVMYVGYLEKYSGARWNSPGGSTGMYYYRGYLYLEGSSIPVPTKFNPELDYEEI